MSQLKDLEQQCPDASDFLDVLAFFDPDSIPLEMLITGAKALLEAPAAESSILTSDSLLTLMQSPLQRQNTITKLQDQCLVSYHTNSRSPAFRIHGIEDFWYSRPDSARGLGTHKEPRYISKVV
jgi:hypothetical protein